MITTDGGGSDGSRVQLFKAELHKLADKTGLPLQVCQVPPGTSKWNRIEHRLFCHITKTWRGKPLTSRLAVVELIVLTTTRTGLQVRCELDARAYPNGIKISAAPLDEADRDRYPPHSAGVSLLILVNNQFRKARSRGESCLARG